MGTEFQFRTMTVSYGWGDACTTVEMSSMPLNRTLENGEDGELHVSFTRIKTVHLTSLSTLTTFLGGGVEGDRHSSPQEGWERPLSPSPSLGLDLKILCFSWDLHSSPSGLITRAKPGVSLRLPTPLPASGPLLQGMETGHPLWKHPGRWRLRGLRRGRFGP